MAAPEDQTSSSTYVQEGDKVISDLPAQLLGNLDDAKEEFDSQELSSSSESDFESGSGSESEVGDAEPDHTFQEHGEDEVQDVSWRLTVYHESTYNDLDPIRTGTFKLKSSFDVKIGTDDSCHKAEKKSKFAQHHRSTRSHRSVLEVITHAVEAYSKRDRKSSLHSPRSWQRSASPASVPPIPTRRRNDPKTRYPPEDLRIKRVFKVELALHSKYLRRVLKSMIKYYPSHAEENFRRSILISEPYAVLMHHYEDIEAWIRTHAVTIGQGVHDKSPKGLRKEVAHMTILRDFLRDKFESTVHPSLQHLARDKPVISFDSLWVLFAPGEDIYGQISGELGVFVVEAVGKDPDHLSHTQDWRISCWDMVTNGHRIARSTNQYHISPFAGLREVLSLPVCPAKIWDAHDGGARRKRILERNRLHLDALRAGSSQFHFDGKDLTTQSAYRGKVVIDHKTGWNARFDVFGLPALNNVNDGYQTYVSYDHIYLKDDAEYDGSTWSSSAPNPRPPPQRYRSARGSTRAPKRRGQRDYTDWNDVPSTGYDGALIDNPIDLHAKDTYKTSEVTEHQLLLLNPLAPAFALSTKQWMKVSMENVRLIKPSPESINNVVLANPDALQTLRALSARQNAGLRSWSADFIEGKGAGQIVLLHGPPGVGKTYTVESIAAWLERPLLALTVADIGTVETKIESELLKFFDLAEAWNAVLLVDEADIFLEQRKNRDLARNGLVSAFLRRMEYFRGLLFLTTNRVGQIDDAFMSRVHVAIGYEPLTTEARNTIWKGFFSKLEKERNSEIKVGKAAKRYILESEEVRKIELNGREIRNALQTAITLAEYETLESGNATASDLVLVEEDHFRRVLTMSQKFHTYVTSIRKEDAKKRAAARGDRNDYED